MADHDRIFLEPPSDEAMARGDGRYWCPEKFDRDWTEYVRADLYDSAIERATKAEMDIQLIRPTDADKADVQRLRKEYRSKLRALYGDADTLPMQIDRLSRNVAALTAENERLKLEAAGLTAERAALRGELQRSTDHFEEWARYHSDERTAETDAIIHCARAAIKGAGHA